MKARRLAKINPVTWRAYLSFSPSLRMEPAKDRLNAPAKAITRPIPEYGPLSKASSASKTAVAVDKLRKKPTESGRSMDNDANMPRIAVTEEKKRYEISSTLSRIKVKAEYRSVPHIIA